MYLTTNKKTNRMQRGWYYELPPKESIVLQEYENFYEVEDIPSPEQKAGFIGYLCFDGEKFSTEFEEYIPSLEESYTKRIQTLEQALLDIMGV